MMTSLVVYDVADNRMRRRLAGVLEGFGVRVQDSVFECRLSATELPVLLRRMRRIVGENATAGGVRVYRLCGGCLRASFELGTSTTPPTGGPWIIL